MHFFIWAGAIIAGNSFLLDVPHDVFPQVGLGEIPVKFERRDVAALDGIDISLYLRLVQDTIVITEFRDGKVDALNTLSSSPKTKSSASIIARVSSVWTSRPIRLSI